MDNATTLASLAMLKVNADTYKNDYVDYLVPFVSYVLSQARPDPVTKTGTQQLLREEFRLEIPLHVIEYVLRRIAKKTFLKRENHQFHIAKDLPERDIDSKRAAAQRYQTVVVNKVKEHAATEFGVEWDNDKAVDAILAYLAQFSIECLKSHTHECVLPQFREIQEQDLFIVNSLIMHAHGNWPDVFDCVIALVQGHMLANALICADLESTKQKFDKVMFYFDTPLVIKLLGLEGEHSETAATELLQLVQGLRGRVAIFSHTFDEIDRVIHAAEGNLDNPEIIGPIVDEARKSGRSASDLALLRGRLEKMIRSHAISIHQTPRHSHDYQIDEAGLEGAIKNEINYRNPRALQDDINSIRSIYELRSGQEPRRIESANAIFVTSNSLLAKAAAEFGRHDESRLAISSVITDFSLANIAWLKAPLTVEIPRLELLANCYAAMEPSETLWSKYVAEINKLERDGVITPDDHAILRYSSKAREELMYLTLGAEDELSPLRFNEILDRVKEDLVREKEASHNRTKAELRRMQEEKLKGETRRTEVAEKIGRIVYFGTFFGLGVSFIALTTVTLGIKAIRDSVPAMFVVVGVIVLAIIAVLRGLFGGNIRSIAETAQDYAEKMSTKFLSSLASGNIEEVIEDPNAV